MAVFIALFGVSRESVVASGASSRAAFSEGGAEFLADDSLHRSLETTIRRLSLERQIREERLAVSLVDISELERPRYAGLNDRRMMYAASLPKIAILLAGFEKVNEGLLRYTSAVKGMFTRMIRWSSNEAASRAVQQVGFGYIAKTLTSDKYHLYDFRGGGGLWLGKAYGGPNDRWRRDPLHNLSHGANSYQVARFFYMLERGELVNPRYSAEMKEILSRPAIHHKFVKGLAARPNRTIYRKSGTWRSWHSDAALIEAGDKRYIAVALMQDRNGGAILSKLIFHLDSLITAEPAPARRLLTAVIEPASQSRRQSFGARLRR